MFRLLNHHCQSREIIQQTAPVISLPSQFSPVQCGSEDCLHEIQEKIVPFASQKKKEVGTTEHSHQNEAKPFTSAIVFLHHHTITIAYSLLCSVLSFDDFNVHGCFLRPRWRPGMSTLVGKSRVGLGSRIGQAANEMFVRNT
jgi:hypothetical protein